MKTVWVVRAGALLVCIGVVAFVWIQRLPKSESNLNFLETGPHGALQLPLPIRRSALPPAANDPGLDSKAEKDRYLGGRLYARPDGEVFTLPPGK